jgi:anti-anti-sigma factor
MRFDERREGSAVVLTPHGDLDATELPAFAARVEALGADGVRTLIVDLSRVTILPSTAAGFLTQAAQRLRAVGGRVVLAGATRRVRGTLSTMGVLDLFPVYDDAATALQRTTGIT